MINNLEELENDALAIQLESNKEIKRSKIYIRDNGICDVCRRFVMLKDYELGHIIDRSNGGSYDWENLVVMHRECNHAKPHHNTVEEYNKWKLTKHLAIASNSRPQYIAKEQLTYIGETKETVPIITQINTNQSEIPNIAFNSKFYPQDKEKQKTFIAGQQLVLEYFKNRPRLLKGGKNHDRSMAIEQLSKDLGISIIIVRRWLVEASLVKPKIIDKSGKPYLFIQNNFNELSEQYNKLQDKNRATIMKYLHLTFYQVDILWFFLGETDKMYPNHLRAISKIVKRMNLQVPNTLDKSADEPIILT